MKYDVIIIGAGPGGIFAAYELVKDAPQLKIAVLEAGNPLEKRKCPIDGVKVKSCINCKTCAIMNGFGGAGAFSDGKLTTRIKDPKCAFILRELVAFGAPKEIIYQGKPHVGTDILKIVVKNIREEIKSLGGEVHFNSKLENIDIKNGKLRGILNRND